MKFILTGIDPDNPETRKNGGGRALLYLHELLHFAGHDCEINAPVGPADIVVYPDCVQGNPCNAAKVLRYMLYFWPGERIPASDCVIVYHEDYFDQVAQKYDRELPVENIVYIPCVEPDLFYPEEKTIEAVLFTGKLNCPDRPAEPMLEISKTSMTRADFAATLRKTKRLYSLDHHTIVFIEAALCGCLTWKVTDAGRGFEEVKVTNPQQYVMNPERDVALARKFADIALAFFK